MKKRILFIDDDYAYREVMSEVLEFAGYGVVAEGSAEKAVDLFLEDPARFDVVLTDLVMPGMAGDVLSERIHAVRPDVPVVVITGFPDSITPERAGVAGIRKILSKTLSRKELFSALEEVG
ncbi:MAG: response regulator [Syntrophorhabdales bacterium]